MQPCKTPSVIAATPSAQEAKAMFCQREKVMEMLLSELMLFVGAVAVCTLENTNC
jgi:hypothetical protein